MVFEAFVNEGDVVLRTNPTFVVYSLYSKIYNGTIYDSIEVMRMIDTIYKSDKSWGKFFFNDR